MSERHEHGSGVGPPKLVVAGLLARPDGRVLLTRRRADQPLPLEWELPGGKIEPGESPERALARELREEIDVAVEVAAIWDVLFHRTDRFDVLMLIYACRLRPGERPRPREVEDLAWVAVADLGDYDILAADAPLIERLVREGAPSDAVGAAD